MKGWFWPHSHHVETTGQIRLGRILHWLMALVSGGLFLFGIDAVSHISPEYRTLYRDEWLPYLAIAVVTYFTGRAARYVLSDE